VVTFLKKNEKLVVRLDFTDGTSMEEELFNRGQKYWYQNTHGEYYMMEGKDLGSYNSSGKRFAVLKRISN